MLPILFFSPGGGDMYIEKYCNYNLKSEIKTFAEIKNKKKRFLFSLSLFHFLYLSICLLNIIIKVKT